MAPQTLNDCKEQIEAKARQARYAGRYVDIDFMLPSICIYLGQELGPDGLDFIYYKERAAQTMLERFGPTAKALGVALKDLILAQAQENSL